MTLRLSVHSLTKSYGNTMAISDVSLAIFKSEVVALAGGNGSGKTTLLKMIAGALVPDSGIIEWDGMTLPPGNPHKRRNLGIEMVFQDGALCPDCSVLENLFLGRELTSTLGFLARREMRNLAEHVVSTYNFPIPGLSVTPRELSGGQQKAVSLARALLSGPRLLLLDEPTAALGVKEQDTILHTLKDLKEAGVAIVFCTHSPDEIRAVADRLLVLRRGTLVHDGALDGISKSELAMLMST